MVARNNRRHHPRQPHRPDHVRMLSPVADGLIVGSAIVRRVAEAATRGRETVLSEIGDYVEELLGAME